MSTNDQIVVFILITLIRYFWLKHRIKKLYVPLKRKEEISHIIFVKYQSVRISISVTGLITVKLRIWGYIPMWFDLP